MRWAGDRGGGYAVLQPYSLNHDYQDRNKSPLFFSETSARALLYATRDFAGGEKLRALRIAIGDLDAYLDQPDMRNRHEEWMSARFRELTQINAAQTMIDAARPEKVDLHWLKREVAGLEDIRRLAEAAYLQYDYGVVYALRMTSDDLGTLSWNNTMGIQAIGQISPSKILEKAIVPRDYEVDDWAGIGTERLTRTGDGLLVALGGRIR
jgi:hypothetical protein